MLIRVVSHFRDKINPHGIDELIRIDGLPDDLMFRKKDGKTYLKFPWEIDVDANIPVFIREHCSPMDITEDLPREKNEATGVWQSPSDTRHILGVKVSLDSTPGQEMWKSVERILDRGTSRDMKVPSPIPVANDQKESFSLEAKDIPVVILKPEIVSVSETKTVASSPAPVVAIEPFNAPKVVDETFTCGVCQKIFDKQRGLWMHERKTRHKVKEPIAV